MDSSTIESEEAREKPSISTALLNRRLCNPQQLRMSIPISSSQIRLELRESRNEGGRGYGRGRGGSGGYRRDSYNGENTYENDNGISYRPSKDWELGKPSERRLYSGPRGGYRGGRRGGLSNAEAEEGKSPRRVYERRSGTDVIILCGQKLSSVAFL